MVALVSALILSSLSASHFHGTCPLAELESHGADTTRSLAMLYSQGRAMLPVLWRNGWPALPSPALTYPIAY